MSESDDSVEIKLYSDKIKKNENNINKWNFYFSEKVPNRKEKISTTTK